MKGKINLVTKNIIILFVGIVSKLSVQLLLFNRYLEARFPLPTNVPVKER
jgi:hypothetical protein